MIDVNSLAGIIILLVLAVVGQTGTMWYKLGRIEGKMDTIMQQVMRNIEDIGQLRNGKENKKR